jgi:hypothetical protein
MSAPGNAPVVSRSLEGATHTKRTSFAFFKIGSASWMAELLPLIGYSHRQFDQFSVCSPLFAEE